MKKLIILLFLSAPVWGQGHEVSLYAGGGLTAFTNNVAVRPGDGAHAGLGYRYYFSPRWSVGTGAEFQVYCSRVSLAEVAGSSAARDAESSNFQFRYQAQNYREDQNVYYLALPLNLQFETGGTRTSWYLNMGGKVAFNTGGSYKATIPSMKTTGYYPEWNVELADPAFMGFGEWNGLRSEKGDLRAATAFLLSAETGIKLPQRFLSYIGIYTDYGLNNILKSGEGSPLVEYVTDTPTAFSYASVNEAVTSSGDPLLTRAGLFALGIKVRVKL